eukprot:SAG11_NODE_1112_length_5821_cov_43.477281_9_plen_62_part_00
MQDHLSKHDEYQVMIDELIVQQQKQDELRKRSRVNAGRLVLHRMPTFDLKTTVDQRLFVAA